MNSRNEKEVNAEGTRCQGVSKAGLLKGEGECCHSTVQQKIDEEGRFLSPLGVSAFHASPLSSPVRVDTRPHALSGHASLVEIPRVKC